MGLVKLVIEIAVILLGKADDDFEVDWDNFDGKIFWNKSSRSIKIG